MCMYVNEIEVWVAFCQKPMEFIERFQVQDLFSFWAFINVNRQNLSFSMLLLWIRQISIEIRKYQAFSLSSKWLFRGERTTQIHAFWILLQMYSYVCQVPLLLHAKPFTIVIFYLSRLFHSKIFKCYLEIHICIKLVCVRVFTCIILCGYLL